MHRTGLSALVILTLTFASVLVAGQPAAAAAPPSIKPGLYMVKYSGTVAGASLGSRYGIILVLDETNFTLPKVTGPGGRINPFEICFGSGNPYRMDPGSIQLETRTNACPYDTGRGTAQLASVTADAATGRVWVDLHNVVGGSNPYGGMNCSALPSGANPNMFVGTPNWLTGLAEPITVCDGSMQLTFGSGTVSGTISAWGYSLGGSGSSFRSYNATIICSKWMAPGSPITAPC